MKYRRLKVISFLLPVMMMAFLYSCVKQNFDEPPVIIPKVNFASNISIQDFKNLYPGSLLEITTDTIIQGIVTGNDESGNIYKTIFIQDNTAGIEIKINQVDLYTEYKLGQRLFIKCKGLYLGSYNGAIQLGYIYNSDIGQIPSTMIADHIYRDSLPGPHPVAEVVDPKSSVMFDKIGSLVQFKRIRFANPGQPFVLPGDNSTSRDLQDSLGNPISNGGNTVTIYTSKYATFSNSLLPVGTGDLTGILSIYSGQFELFVRDLNDLANFDTVPIPVGSEFVYPVGSPTPVDSLIENFDNVKPAQGSRNWQGKTYLTDKYAQATAYNSTDASNMPWMITKPVVYNSGLKLSFKSAMAYYKHNGLSVWILYDWTGDTATCTWKPITNVTLANGGNTNYEWVGSGEVLLSEYVPSGYTGNIYIGFKYTGEPSNNTTTYCVDEVKVIKGSGGSGGVVTEVHENFDNSVNYTDISIPGWTNTATEGNRRWQGKTYLTDKYAQATAYNSTDASNVTYLITPEVQYHSGMTLDFKSAMAYYVHNGLSVLISTDFDGSNVTSATWITISATLAGSSNSNYEWVSSGTVDLAPYLPASYTGTFFVAFKYSGTAALNTTSYCIDEVNIQ
jgi:hypothetical protein